MKLNDFSLLNIYIVSMGNSSSPLHGLAVVGESVKQ